MGGPASGGSGAIDIPWLPGLLGLFHFHVKAELIMHRDTLTYDWLTMYVVSYLSLSFMCVYVIYLNLVTICRSKMQIVRLNAITNSKAPCDIPAMPIPATKENLAKALKRDPPSRKTTTSSKPGRPHRHP